MGLHFFKNVVTILAIFLLTFISGCSSGGGDNDDQPSPEPTNNTATLAPNTKQLTEATTNDLVSVNTDPTTQQSTFIFSKSSTELQSASVGEPIILGITPETPDGFMGKISSISFDASGNTVVTTEPAALNEVFENLEISFNGSMDASNVRSVTSAYATRSVTQNGGATRALSGSTGVITREFDLSTADGLINKLTVNFSSTYDIDISIRMFQVKKFEFKADPTVSVSHQVGAKAKLSLGAINKTLATVKCAAVPIPGTPLFIVPVLTLKLTASGGVEAEATLTTTRTVQYTAEIAYDGDIWTNAFNKISDEKTFSREVKAGGFVEATLTPQVDLWLNGVAGPYAQFNMNAKVTIAPCSDPWLKAEAGAKLDIGVRVRLISSLNYNITGYDLVPYGIVDQTTGPFPYTGVVTGTVWDAITNQALPSVNISFKDANEGVINVFTNAVGIYSTALCPCTYTANFSKDGYSPIEKAIDDILVDKISTHDVVMNSGIDHIKLTAEKTTLNPEETTQITATAYADIAEQIIVPSVATDYTWSATSGSGIFDTSGVFTAGKVGSVVITVVHKTSNVINTTNFMIQSIFTGSWYGNCVKSDGTELDYFYFNIVDNYDYENELIFTSHNWGSSYIGNTINEPGWYTGSVNGNIFETSWYNGDNCVHTRVN